MDADEMRRRAEAAAKANEARRVAKVEPRMPKMRAKVREAIDARLQETANYGLYETNLVVGTFVADEDGIFAARRAAQEAIPELERRGFKARIVEYPGSPGTTVAIHVDWH